MVYYYYNYYYSKSKSKSFDLLRTKIYIEHKIFCQLKHDQDWSVNLPSGSRQGRLLFDPLNINYIVIWPSFHNTKNISIFVVIFSIYLNIIYMGFKIY